MRRGSMVLGPLPPYGLGSPIDTVVSSPGARHTEFDASF